MNFQEKNQFDILNPNCSEVVWRLPGVRGRFKGSNEEPFAIFIQDILEIWTEFGWDTKTILNSQPEYIKGDGGPDVLEWSYKYAQDLVAGIRDSRELEFDQELDEAIVNKGYDEKISEIWTPLVSTPKDSTAPPTEVEKLLAEIAQNPPFVPKIPKKTSNKKKSNPIKIKIDSKKEIIADMIHKFQNLIDGFKFNKMSKNFIEYYRRNKVWNKNGLLKI